MNNKLYDETAILWFTENELLNLNSEYDLLNLLTYDEIDVKRL